MTNITGMLLILPMIAASVTGPELIIQKEAGSYRVQIGGGDALVTSPVEGLWSIASGWESDWPASWQHAHPETFEKSGEWTLLRGKLPIGDGYWELSDAYRPEKGLIRCTRRFVWHGEQPLDKCTLSVRFVVSGNGPRVVLPSVLYHGNPSGAKSGRTPVFMGAPGEQAYFEEHRFAMPFASFEWQSGNVWQGATLHSLPCPAPHGNHQDQWWSLGISAYENFTELALLSGPCASNGQNSVIKAVQPGFVPYPDTWLTVPPGAIIEKTFYLDAYPVEREGAGFQQAVKASLELYPPLVTPDLPTFSDIIRGKLRYAETRWLDHGEVAGYRKYPDRDTLVMGWCGQAEALGYALPVLENHFDIPGGRERAQRSLDFLSRADFFEHGFHTWYLPDVNRWERNEMLSQGQAMLCFANAIRVGREKSMDTRLWEEFLRKACAFHTGRILDDNWSPLSTDQAFFIAPLCAAAALFREPAWQQAAIKAGEVYAARSLSMQEPYWGGTLDASCEDKEGAFAALQGFLALYESTGEARFLDWATHALDVMLTYVVVWDIDLPPGRLRNHGFKTRGWTVVSPQNQHIDVFGVLIAPLVYRMGQLKNSTQLMDLALIMFRSCGQLMDPQGSQGEQPQHTNYAQRGNVDTIESLRGGYVEDWTVFWITAHFLNAAAQFVELGAPVFE